MNLDFPFIGLKMKPPWHLLLQATEPDKLGEALNVALDAGYRLIDTALAYENEHIIGDTLKARMTQGKLKRDDFFITTKVNACMTWWTDKQNDAVGHW